jgi:hypothetical protein
MNIPAMYIVGLTANLIFLVLTIFSYFYLINKTGYRHMFLIFFTVAWILSALSSVYLISGINSDEWYITLCRIISYLFFLATVISVTVELARLKRP